VTNHLRFPGQYYDPETNTHYNYFRDYEPGTGRYGQRDPIGLAGGVNVYSYALGNALNYKDPTGEIVPVVIYPAVLVTGVIVGAVIGSGTTHPGGGNNNRSTCWLYWITDCNGEIVYVGITNDTGRREGEHENSPAGKINQYQCPQCRLKFNPVKMYGSRSECKKDESKQIQQFRPIFNDQENPDSLETRERKRQEWRSKNCQCG